jgi:AP-4 complex subunit mu-1
MLIKQEACYSQFYCLSPRGDSIIYRDVRGDGKSTAEIFFRNVKFWAGKEQDAPPMFNLFKVNYCYLHRVGLYFVLTSTRNVPPAFTMQLLDRLTKVFKDYLGVLDEDSIRTNFTLIYELLDEMMDFGYVAGTSSDLLKAHVHNQPVSTIPTKVQSKIKDLLNLDSKTTPSNSVDKSIISKQKNAKNEIYVDIYERLNVTFNSNGYILNSSINGCIQMKSFLQGNPPLRLSFNEGMVVLSEGTPGYRDLSGVCVLDDCNFHECVKTADFATGRTLNFVPPDGEFVVMNYRITSDFKPPFRIFPFFELTSPYAVELVVTIRAEVPRNFYGQNVRVIIPMPPKAAGAASEIDNTTTPGQTVNYDNKTQKVTWTIKRFTGETELALRTRISLSTAHTAAVRKSIGPISMEFELPMYNPSGLAVKSLRVVADADYNPYRWVRYVTKSANYVCRC